MNKQEVISQGYLESYITQDLDAKTTDEVLDLLKDPEVRLEYFKVQQTLENLAFHYAMAPSPVLKKLILSEVANKSSHHSNQGGGWNLMMAASILMVLSSAFVTFHFWSKWKNTDAELSTLTAQHMIMAESLQQVNHELGSIQSNLAILISPEYSRIIMKGTDNAPNAQAVVYWNPSQEKVFLHAASLATLNVNQQYQLWALIDGKPIDAGVFDANQNAFVQMKNISQADAFAVTVEKQGGSVAPTLSTLQVIGNISS